MNEIVFLVGCFLIACGAAHGGMDFSMADRIHTGLREVEKAVKDLAEAVRESEKWPPERK